MIPRASLTARGALRARLAALAVGALRAPVPAPAGGWAPALPAARALATTLAPAELDAHIGSAPVVLFTKSYCSFCRDLVERFIDAEVDAKVVALDSFGAWERGGVVGRVATWRRCVCVGGWA